MAYCVTKKLPGGGYAIIRMSGKPTKCAFCGNLSTKLCDFRISPPEVVTHAKTCDTPMCDDHAHSVGPDKDFCPPHRARIGGL